MEARPQLTVSIKSEYALPFSLAIQILAKIQLVIFVRSPPANIIKLQLAFVGFLFHRSKSCYIASFLYL